MADNETDEISGGGDVGLPDCAACGRPEKKHRATDNMCPPKSGSLFNVRYWLDGPGTYYVQPPADRAVTVLSPDAFDRLVEDLKNPPEPNAPLKKLMSEPSALERVLDACPRMGWCPDECPSLRGEAGCVDLGDSPEDFGDQDLSEFGD